MASQLLMRLVATTRGIAVFLDDMKNHLIVQLLTDSFCE